MSESQQDGQPQNGQQSTVERPPPEIDVQQLADRVYRLMLAELRLTGARGGQIRPTWKG